ncbi:MAG: hypothetical protein K2Y71_21365 [Xanthobacteraceae bacterium]|nr:hypothetical protein [Xanthobacteraceae bacterium]
MTNKIARKLAASTAAGALGVLLIAAPALAQGQGRDGPQAGVSAGAGGEMRGGGQMRGGGEMRGGQMRGGGEMRGNGGARVDAGSRSNLRAQGNVRIRDDVRVQGRRDGSRADVRIRDRGDANIRAGFRSDRHVAWHGDWRGGDRWRYRNRGTSVSIGFGFSEPYYGYDDGYYAYGAAEPYAYRGYRNAYHGSGYYSYAATPGCTCAPGGAHVGWNNPGWGGHSWGFAAW